MNRGEVVMVRSFLSQPIVRRLWSEDNNLAHICREEEYQRWEQGGESPHCTEILKDTIFKYDATLYKDMKRFDPIVEALPAELTYLWQKAEHFFK